ncbi:MAG: diguanylate cyclase [Myxococcota bacterium]
MSATTRSLLRRPNTVEASWPTGVAMLAAILYPVGYAGNPALPMWLNVPVAAALLAISGALLWRSRNARDADQGLSFELERSLLFVSTSFVVVRTLGGFGIDAYPLIYLVLAFLVTFQTGRAGAVSVIAALALEGASHAFGTYAGAPSMSVGIEPSTQIAWSVMVTRGLFLALFGFLSFIIHGTEVLERRRRHRQEVAEERENIVRRAREYRLLNSGRVASSRADAQQAEQMAVYDAVEAVHHTVYVSLSMLKAALHCHTCVLLWFDVRGELLHIKELVSDSDELIEGGIPSAKGVIGGIARRREPVKLDNIRSGYKGIPYYRNPQDVRQFLGVPVIEHGHLRGVLCADRRGADTFTSSDIAVAQDAAAYILRSVENERIFTSVEKTKYELSQFFEASRNLNGVLTPEQVYDVALESLARIVDYDLAAITVYEDETNTHHVEIVDGSERLGRDVSEWQGNVFEDNAGLVSMVIKNRHYLPYGGKVRDADPVVFDEEQRLEGLESMLVIPLIAQDAPIGTLVVASRDDNQFGTERREMLEVIVNQVAISLQNARLYSQMEEMATTDGLTGLANHRSFQSRLEEVIARHKRSEEPFGLLLTDIDHFKPVNDTYGHPVGDEVLRQVSGVFRELLREVDLPCRYGGEEFAIILEDTDREGAMKTANRLREAISELEFDTEKGSFSVTMSMGVTIWPEDRREKQPLIDLTDEALYYSKENGRNRVTSATQLGS